MSSSSRRRGRPLPPDLRSRVMRLLRLGHGPSEVARRLLVSRQTVYRYCKAAEEQQATVPAPKPAGGWRHGKINRAQIVALARLALDHPKDTLEELRERAADAQVFPAHGLPSRSAVSRALHKAGVGQKSARFVDKRTESDPLIALERRLFKEAQIKVGYTVNRASLDASIVDEAGLQRLVASVVLLRPAMPTPAESGTTRRDQCSDQHTSND